MSPQEKKGYALKYPNWPSDEFAQRIPKADVGAFPPEGGTAYYKNKKRRDESDEDWYEYHIDFLPEELVVPLNGGRGGFVSQRRYVKMPVAAPRRNKECIERLRDLLTVSCPQTLQLLQKQIDKIIIGSRIRYYFSYTHTHTHHIHIHAHHTHTHTHIHRKDFSGTMFNGTITKRSFDGLSNDARPLYKAVYEDDDEEELWAEQVLAIMQVRVSSLLASCKLSLSLLAGT